MTRVNGEVTWQSDHTRLRLGKLRASLICRCDRSILCGGIGVRRAMRRLISRIGTLFIATSTWKTNDYVYQGSCDVVFPGGRSEDCAITYHSALCAGGADRSHCAASDVARNANEVKHARTSTRDTDANSGVLVRQVRPKHDETNGRDGREAVISAAIRAPVSFMLRDYSSAKVVSVYRM